MATKGICSVEGCDKPRLAKGYCSAHYARWRNGDAEIDRPLRKKQRGTCAVDGCESLTDARGYCTRHYGILMRYGDPLHPALKQNVKEGANLIAVALFERPQGCLIWPFTRNWCGYAMHLRRRVHRIICEGIHGPAPDGKPNALHGCGNGHLGCYSPDCVRWGDQKENMADQILHGRSNRGSRHGLSKLSEEDVRKIRSLKGVCTAKSIADEFGISENYVTHIWMRIAWNWLG